MAAVLPRSQLSGLGAALLILLSIPLSAGFFFLHPYEEAAWAIFYRDITAAPSDTEEI